MIEYRYDAYGHASAETHPLVLEPFAYRQTLAVKAGGQISQRMRGSGTGI